MTDDQDPTCDTDDITPEDSVPVGRSHSYMESLVALSAHQAEKNTTTDIHRTAPELDTFEAETLRQLLFSPGSEDGHGLPPRHAATVCLFGGGIFELGAATIKPVILCRSMLS